MKFEIGNFSSIGSEVESKNVRIKKSEVELSSCNTQKLFVVVEMDANIATQIVNVVKQSAGYKIIHRATPSFLIPHRSLYRLVYNNGFLDS